MKKHPFKRTAALILSLAILCPTAGISAMAESAQRQTDLQQRISALAAVGLKAKFTSEYAKAGQPLTVKVEGAPAGTTFTYAWMVDNTQVNGNNTDTYTPTQSDNEHFIKVTVSASGYESVSASLYCSKLPVIYIDTAGKPIADKENYVDATMSFQGNDKFNQDNTTLYDGAIEIRGRGNITWTYPKKPYKIKLDSSTNLFGMGKNKHWVLLANWEDGSLMRNRLAFDFSSASDMPYMQETWVSVVLNGSYTGNYQFCEQIRIASDRVNIQNLEDAPEDVAKAIAKAEGLSKDVRDEMQATLENNLAWMTSDTFTFQGVVYTVSDYCELPDITGGYLMELDEYFDEVSQFKTKSGQPMMFKNPEFAGTNPDMMNYVQTYVQAFENAVNAPDYYASYDGKNLHYSDLFDMDSLVDFWINNELFFNGDGGRKSTYMYKGVDEKFKMGPIWDMDWSSGGMGDTQATNRWWVNFFSTNAQKDMWTKYLVTDPYFLVRASERYWDVHNAMTDIVRSGGQMDQHYDYVLDSANANYNLWKAKGAASFGPAFTHLKDWMTNRISWLDQQFATETSLFNSVNKYKKDTSLSLMLTDASGNALAADTVSEKLPANAMVYQGSQVKLAVTVGNSNMKKVGVYVNGTLVNTTTVSGGKANITLDSNTLVLAAEGKNVIQVRGLSSSNAVLGSNYITLLQTIDENKVTELKLTPPTKLSYYEGEALDLTGMKVEAITASGSKKDVTSLATVSGFSSTPGTKTVTVSYEGVSATFNVTVLSTELLSIKVTTPPTKTMYLEGEKLDTTGLVVEGVYSDGSTRPVTGYEVRGYRSEPGIHTIEVVYEGKIATFEVKVVGLAVISGVIKDSEGLPVANAKVTLAAAAQAKSLPAVTYTNHAGQYTFRDIPFGNYVLSVSKSGYADQTITVAADSHSTTVDDTTVVQKADTSTLELVLAFADGYIKDGSVNAMIPTAKENFMKVYNRALGLVDDLDATQAEVDKAWKDLMWVIQALNFVPGDKTELRVLLTRAEKIDLTAYEDGQSKEDFRIALKAAQDLKDDADAMAADIDSACNVLNQAIKNLIPLPIAGNKSELEKVLVIARGYDLSKYVDDATAKTAFANALKKAEDIFGKTSATQEEIDASKLELLSAMGQLRLRADKSSLLEWIEKLKGIDFAKYTPESASLLIDALARAEALAAQDLSVEETDIIAAQIIELQLAHEALVLKPQDPQNPSSDPSESEKPDSSKPADSSTSQTVSGSSQADSTKKPTTGDTAPIALSLLAISAAGAILVLKRRRR